MKHVLALTLVLILVTSLVACNTNDDTTPSTPIPDITSTTTEPQTTEPPVTTDTGLLIAAGTGYIHAYDLATDDSWRRPLSYSGPWSTVALIPQERELLIANTSGANPVVVTSYDIDSFGQKQAFEWPDSTHISTLHALAATTDGRYYALVMESADPYLEIVERDTGRIVYSGLNIATGAGMTWTTDHHLIVPLDLSHEDNSERWGAIASFSLQDLEATSDESVDGELIVTFTRAEWDRGIRDLALTPDDSQLIYTRAGDLWITDLEPGSTARQLTTGPQGHFGATVSPTGDQLALVTGDNLGLRNTYIMDLHSGAPLDPDTLPASTQLLEDNTLVDRILGWLP